MNYQRSFCAFLFCWEVVSARKPGEREKFPLLKESVVHMYALFLVLNETDYLDEILARFVDVGVRGATILDSQGMAGALTAAREEDPSFFASLKILFEGARPYNKTIFTVLESEELVERAVAAAKDILGDTPRPGVGFMFSVPIGKIYSLSND